MNLVLASTGGYPRGGDTPELQILERTLAAMERGERTAADLADAENEMTRRAIEEQAQAGIELFTDGMIRGYDPVSFMAGKLENVTIDGREPYFDTGRPYRVPVVRGKPTRTAPMFIEHYQFARNALGLIPTGGERAGRIAIKVVLTGPYTLARLSRAEAEEFKPLEARAEAFAVALAEEISALADAGADFVQVDEPALLQHLEDWPLFCRVFAPLSRAKQQAVQKGRKIQLAVYLPYGDAAPLYEKLTELSVNAIGLDFVRGPKLAEIVAREGAALPLGLGLVDGLRPELEDCATLARLVEKLLPRIGGSKAYLGAASGLETLPRAAARAKLALLRQIRNTTHK
jgi:5-methyltetrahydropteroyltriglutamate--homocysteine methyltransferase